MHEEATVSLLQVQGGVDRSAEGPPLGVWAVVEGWWVVAGCLSAVAELANSTSRSWR
ncbi:MAG: hypothetical protein V5A43_04165 [Haloarculaceae archaeon]